MALQSSVDTALKHAEDPSAILVWRRTCRELASGPRVGVAALTASAAVRAVEHLSTAGTGVGMAALGFDPDEDSGDAPPMVRDALLGVHTVVWATAASQPLGARERTALRQIAGATGMERGLILIVDTHVLERMSDDAAAELQSVRERVAAQAPDGWRVCVQGDAELQTFFDVVRVDQEHLTRQRHHHVARILLDSAHRGLEAGIVHEVEQVALLEASLASEDEALDRAREAGTRAAAHTLGVLRRRTEELRMDLREFLREIEADVPDQIGSLADVETARRVLPHWLEHVVQGWLRDRLASWRVQVQADLAHVRVADEALAHADLLLPAVHPAPIPSEGRWRRALGLTAGVGGGLVLVAFQLWIPALIAASGGVAWSMLDRDGAGPRRERLQERAVDAVRQLGLDADRVLGEQLQRFEDQLSTLGESRAAKMETDRAEARAGLHARLRLHQARLEDAKHGLKRFTDQVRDVGLPEPQP
ncbi:MAG: hypothetical protein AB8H79_11845 [Myxococcota bacterium]